MKCILLIFKSYVYQSRGKQFANINNLIPKIKSAKKIEKEIAASNSKKTISITYNPGQNISDKL